MLTAELDRCLHAEGCVASLYLPTPSGETGSAHDAAVRWQNLRRELAGAGVDDRTLAAIDGAVGVDTEAVSGEVTASPDNRRNAGEVDDQADHAEGDVLAVIAAEGEVLLRRPLAAAGPGGVRAAPIAWLTPLLEAEQGQVPYLVVLLDRKGADVWGAGAGGDWVDVEIDGADHPIRRVHAGGWSQRRFQQRAINTWEANAAEVASEVESIAARAGITRVLVAGEDHTVSSFLGAASGALQPLLRQLSRGNRHAPGDTGEVGDEVRRLVQTVTAEETVALLEQFKEARSKARAADGPVEVVAALQMAVVDTLLVHDDPDDRRRGWYADDVGQVALDRDALDAMGAEQPREARLLDVCVRTALLQGSTIRVVPAAVLDGGLGAVLRAPLAGAEGS